MPSALCLLCILGTLYEADAVTVRRAAPAEDPEASLPPSDEQPAGPARGPCEVCELGGSNVARLFIWGRKDGLGATVHSIICGMAIAAKLKFRFGGMLQGLHESHGVRIARTVEDFFGLSRENGLVVSRSALNGHGLRIIDKEKIEFHRKYSANNNVLFNTTTPQYWIGAERYPQYLHSGFLAALKAQVMPGLTPRLSLFKPGVPWVALHIRRGDVTSEDTSRFTPDSWYLQTVEQIRKSIPDADVHAWSSTEGGNQTLADFQSFTEAGIPVHLDGDPLDAWAHFAAARVLVMAKGTFSRVPALVSGGCVVFERGSPPTYVLPRWVDGTKVTRPGYAQELARCIERSATA